MKFNYKKLLFKLSKRDNEVKVGVFLFLKSIIAISLIDIFIIDMFYMINFVVSIMLIKGYISKLIIKYAWYV